MLGVGILSQPRAVDLRVVDPLLAALVTRAHGREAANWYAREARFASAVEAVDALLARAPEAG